jgi:hypothetical protein
MILTVPSLIYAKHTKNSITALQVRGFVASAAESVGSGPTHAVAASLRGTVEAH